MHFIYPEYARLSITLDPIGEKKAWNLDGADRFFTLTIINQIGSSWVVRDGLNPGERVIVDGIQKVAPGMRVKPKPARETPRPGN